STSPRETWSADDVRVRRRGRVGGREDDTNAFHFHATTWFGASTVSSDPSFRRHVSGSDPASRSTAPIPAPT
ncbi:unnamed protein product, partial [Trichogramma brassicae]